MKSTDPSSVTVLRALGLATLLCWSSHGIAQEPNSSEFEAFKKVHGQVAAARKANQSISADITASYDSNFDGWVAKVAPTAASCAGWPEGEREKQNFAKQYERSMITQSRVQELQVMIKRFAKLPDPEIEYAKQQIARLCGMICDQTFLRLEGLTDESQRVVRSLGNDPTNPEGLCRAFAAAHLAIASTKVESNQERKELKKLLKDLEQIGAKPAANGEEFHRRFGEYCRRFSTDSIALQREEAMRNSIEAFVSKHVEFRRWLTAKRLREYTNIRLGIAKKANSRVEQTRSEDALAEAAVREYSHRKSHLDVRLAEQAEAISHEIVGLQESHDGNRFDTSSYSGNTVKVAKKHLANAMVLLNATGDEQIVQKLQELSK